MRFSSLAGLILLAGCAQDLPGADMPARQLYFPQGLLHVPDGDDVLVVASTNFDQRYNSGRLTTFDVPALFERTATANGSPIIFDENLSDLIIDSIRIDSFAGQMLHTDGRLFVASRFRNLLTMLDLSAEGQLDCGNGEVELDFRFECTRGRFVSTLSEDPFALALASLTSTNGNDDIIAVAHLRVGVTATNLAFQNVTLVSRSEFEERLAQERAGDELVEPARTQTFTDFGGVSGMVYLPPPPLGPSFAGAQGAFLTIERARTPDVAVNTFTLEKDSNTLAVDRLVDLRISLDAQTRSLRSRGMILGPVDPVLGFATRAYAALEFQETADAFNSAIAVLDVSGAEPRFLSALEVGDELGPPVVLERPSELGPERTKRFLYVPDIRLNRIYVLDASSDDLLLVATITGAVERRVDGETFVAFGFSGPSGMAIAERDGRTLGFVTNFLNSTLAVLDLTDPDPRRHRVIARFGRAIDAFGDPEGP